MVWATYLRARWTVWRAATPEAVRRMGTVGHVHAAGPSPRAWSRLVVRALRHGPHQPRCVFEALTLYRILVLHGHRPDLVIGLPTHATTPRAHAWVELDGRDLGPSPGTAHVPLARYTPPPHL